MSSLPPFDPLFRNPHLQTVAAHYWPRPDGETRWPAAQRIFRTAPDAQVLMESQRPSGQARGELVMVHGLEGSSRAGYMRSLAAAALEAGFAAHRFNLRTCGGTEQLSETLYHAGLTADLAAVLRVLRSEGRAPVVLVGFSLGANVALKLAGELGAEAPSLICAVCGVSTPIDLEMCARRIGEPGNRLYEQRFVRRMHGRLRATGRLRQSDLKSLRSVVDIDERITAPAFGFGNATNYYRTQSAREYLGTLHVPALLIQAQDDPLAPFAMFEGIEQCGNGNIRLLAPEHGGHVGFLARGRRRFWSDAAIMAWVEELY